MTTIDHAEAARANLRKLFLGEVTVEQSNTSSLFALANATIALAESQAATAAETAHLADQTQKLVEQQRIANLIALAQATDDIGVEVEAPLLALFGYDHNGEAYVRPEIAAALVIEDRP